MATIGLANLVYAKITEDVNGQETYGTPKKMADVIKADVTIDINEVPMYADDRTLYIIKEFKSGKMSLGVEDLPQEVIIDLTGAKEDENGVLISTGEDGGDPVAIGFKARKANKQYRYIWFYKVKFGLPSANLQTKGDSITIQTPTIEGTIQQRNKPDDKGDHPWKAEVDTDNPKAVDIIQTWFDEVYEPEFEV